MNDDVIVYIMNGCIHCKNLKLLIDKRNLDVVVKDIDVYTDEYNIISNAIETDIIPLIRKGDDIYLPEEDFSTIDEAYNLLLTLKNI